MTSSGWPVVHPSPAKGFLLIAGGVRMDKLSEAWLAGYRRAIKDLETETHSLVSQLKAEYELRKEELWEQLSDRQNSESVDLPSITKSER